MDHDSNFKCEDDFNDRAMEMTLEDKWYDIEDDYRERLKDLTGGDLDYDDGRYKEML